MKFTFVVPALFAAAYLSAGSLISTSRAAGYTEVGDAGDLLATGQVVTGAAGTALDSLSGSLTLTNGTSDSDLFEIYINNPAAFSATTNFFLAGSNNFDSQLMIFSATGFGVLADDDAASGSAQAAIVAGSFTGAAGLYYIDISGSGRYATSTSGLIFPNFTDGTTDPTVTYGPTGAGGAGAISGYTGSSNEGGKYQINLAGAQFVPPVPEPATYLYVAAGIAGLAFVTRARRLAVSK